MAFRSWLRRIRVVHATGMVVAAAILLRLGGAQSSAQEPTLAPPMDQSAPAVPAIPEPSPAPTEHLSRDSYQEGWRQVGPGADGLGQRLRSHRVRLNDLGLLEGRLSALDPGSRDLIPVDRVSVNFFQSSREVQKVTPQDDGRFAAPGLAPGVYDLVATGEDGFLAYTVHVLGAPSAQRQASTGRSFAAIRYVSFQEVEVALEIDSLAVPPSSFSALRRLIRQYVPELASAPQLIEPPKTDIPKDALGHESDAGYPAGPGLFHRGDVEGQRADSATTIRQHTVYLQSDGRLLGRVRRLHQETGRPLRVHRTEVFMLRGDHEVARSNVNELGVFEFKDLAPAVYSLVAAGPEGFAAFSVNVEQAPIGQVGIGASRVIPVGLALAAEESAQLEFSLAYDPATLARVREFATGAQAQPIAAAPTGFAPNASSGGGPGGGGLEALAALAGLAGMAAGAGGGGEPAATPFVPQ